MLVEKAKNVINLQRIDVAEVVLVQRNLVDHKYQQKSKVLYAKKIFSEKYILCLCFKC